MRLFTKKELAQLKEYEHHFHTVKFGLYKRASTRSDNELVADVLDAATGRKCTRKWSCARCTFDVWQQAAELYYKSVEAIKQKNNGRKETLHEQEAAKDCRTVAEEGGDDGGRDDNSVPSDGGESGRSCEEGRQGEAPALGGEMQDGEGSDTAEEADGSKR